jgi:hypothetical protein
LPVEDGAGVIGAAITTDDRSLYVVDGNVQSRLRRFNTETWRQDFEQTFSDRVLTTSAAQLVSVTGDNRWLLIKTYDTGAAAHGIRLFDTDNNRFARAGMAADGCAEPLFAASLSGMTAAVCPGSVEIFDSRKGESLVRLAQAAASIHEPAAAVLSPRGKTLFVLESRAAGAPARLWSLSAGAKQQTASWSLDKLLGQSAVRAAEPQTPLVAIDQAGKTLAIVYGADVWLLDTDGMRLRRALKMAGTVSGVAFSADSRTLYTLRRDDAKHNAALGRTEVSAGETEESVILENLPFSALVSGFAISANVSAPVSAKDKP